MNVNISSDVSIHAPTWGATIKPESKYRPFKFQSTHPHGVRRVKTVKGMDYNIVSIHAPTWGATYGTIRLTLHSRCFNPRTHMGCDIIFCNCNLWWKIVSIHAPTWGATYTCICASTGLVVSIHAPTWGATNISVEFMPIRQFQSTHPHGVRLHIQ